MKKFLKGIALCAGCLSAMFALEKPVFADVSLATSANTVTWNNAPNAPDYFSVNPPNTANVAQNNNGATSTGATQYALVETFTPSSSYTLGAVGILVGGGGSSTPISMHLYDVTSSITSTNGTTTQGSGANYSPVTSALTDLFGNGAGLSFNQPASGQVQDTFTLSNGATNDLVSLTSGHTYAFELWVQYAANTFLWERAAAVATDGQMMFSADANNVGSGPISTNPANYPHEDSRVTIASAGFAGGAPRTASLALYSVPEPGTIVLLGLAAPALWFAGRRRS